MEIQAQPLQQRGEAKGEGRRMTIASFVEPLVAVIEGALAFQLRSIEQLRMQQEVGGDLLTAHGAAFRLKGHALDAQVAEDVTARQPHRVDARLQAHGAFHRSTCQSVGKASGSQCRFQCFSSSIFLIFELTSIRLVRKNN